MVSIDDFDLRTKVGSDSWNKRHDEKTKQLSAWRRLHSLLPHEDVTKLAKPTDSSEKLAALAQEVERQLKE